MQAKHNISNVVFEQQCRLDAKLFGKTSYFPRSLNLMHKLLDVKPVAETEIHMCPKCWRRYPYLHPAAWHLDVKCDAANCGEPRFELVKAGIGRKRPSLRPAFKWYCFGLDYLMQTAYADPDFVALLDSGEARKCSSGLHASDHAKELRRQLGEPPYSWSAAEG